MVHACGGVRLGAQDDVWEGVGLDTLTFLR
jgi:hypothetical protein